MDDIQTIAGDHKMVVPEFSGGYLAGTSSEIEGELEDGNGRLDGDQRNPFCGGSLFYELIFEI